MTTDIHKAARDLLKSLDAPSGAVNTLAFKDRRGSVIRVLVDSSYFRRIQSLPKTYKGFRVIVEKREPTNAGHSTRLSAA
jgi:hypothetical protein